MRGSATRRPEYWLFPLPSSYVEDSMGAKRGLEDMNGFLLKVLGDLVCEVRPGRDQDFWYRFRTEISPDLRNSMRQYLQDYNEEHRARLSISFPNKFRLRLRRLRKQGKKHL
jgi:hypothetical protein